MNLKLSLIFFLTALTIHSYSQVDFGIRRQKLKPQAIDTATENTFVYETRNATIYFRQADILEFLNDPESKNILGSYSTQALQDTFQKNTKTIKVKDVLYSYTDEERDSIYKVETISGATKRLNEEFYSVGAALILDGKFMVYSKDQKAVVTKGLIAKRQIGMLGQRDLIFYLPNKKQFYYIITALGE